MSPTEAPEREQEKVSFQTLARNGRRAPGTYRLVIEPGDEYRDSRGERVVDRGHAVEFQGGVLETSDPDEIEFIRNHKDIGVKFAEVEEQPVLVPQEEDPSAVIREIVQAQQDQDGDKLAEIYAREQQTHSRQSVLVAAEAALEVVEDRKPDPVPQPEHQLGRERVGAVRPATPGDAPEANARIEGEVYEHGESGLGPAGERGATVPVDGDVAVEQAGPETPQEPGDGEEKSE